MFAWNCDAQIMRNESQFYKFTTYTRVECSIKIKSRLSDDVPSCQAVRLATVLRIAAAPRASGLRRRVS